MRNLRDLRRTFRSFVNRVSEERNTLARYPLKPGDPNERNIVNRVEFYNELINHANGMLSVIDYLTGSSDNSFADYVQFVEEVCRLHDEHGAFLTMYGDSESEAAREWAEDAAEAYLYAEEWIYGEPLPNFTTQDAVRQLLLGMPPFPKRAKTETSGFAAARQSPPASLEQIIAGSGKTRQDELREQIARTFGLNPEDVQVVVLSGEDVA